MQKLLVLQLLFLIISCSKSDNKSKAEARFEKHLDSLSYAIGLDVAMRLEQQFKDINHQELNKAISDYHLGNALFLNDVERVAVIKKYNTITAPKYKLDQEKENIVEGGKFLNANSKEPGVITHKSGIQYKIITDSKGLKPKPGDEVRVHYIGKLIDGTKFDSSYDRGEAAIFPVDRVVPGFSQGIQLMSIGSKYQLFIPGHLGYGQGEGPGGPMAVMIFQVELLDIMPGEKK